MMHRQRFVYFEQEEGGMSMLDPFNPEGLYRWMDKDCSNADNRLLAWMRNAGVGDMYEHRLGVCVCLKPAAGREADEGEMEEQS